MIVTKATCILALLLFLAAVALHGGASHQKGVDVLVSTTAPPQHPDVHRSLEAPPAVQYRSVLLVRVNNPQVTASQMYRAVFVDLATQMKKCSQGKVILRPFRHAVVGADGVLDITVGLKVNTENVKQEYIDLAEQAAARRFPGTRDVRDLADHVVYVFPFVKDYLASAEMGPAPQFWRPGDRGTYQ